VSLIGALAVIAVLGIERVWFAGGESKRFRSDTASLLNTIELF